MPPKTRGTTRQGKSEGKERAASSTSNKRACTGPPTYETSPTDWGQKRLRREWSHSNSKTESWCFFRDLGNDLLIEILIRLPRKTVVRCKAVCKKWFTLIVEGDFFIRRYIHHRHDSQGSLKRMSLVYQITSVYYLPYLPLPPVRSPKWLFEVNIATENRFVRKLYKDGVVDMRFLPCVQQLFPSILPNRRLDFQLEASCADLLLCSYQNTSTSMTIYYICNVETKQWVVLPPIPACPRSPDVGLLCDPLPCSDCYLEFNAHYNYKLVRTSMASTFRLNVLSELKIQIFCSKEGQWRNSTVSLGRSVRRPSMKNRMIAYNRMLHRLTHDGVIVFDPFCETETPVARVIDLPPDASIDPCHCCFGVSRGRLCLGKVSGSEANPMLLVWELVDYNNVKWCLSLRIPNVSSLFRGLQLKGYVRLDILAFHPYRRDIVYFNVGKYMVKCNVREENKTKVLHEVIVPNDSFGLEFCWPDAFPLVHHWWPTPVPSLP